MKWCGDIPGLGRVEPNDLGVSVRIAPRLLEEDVLEE